MFFFLGGGGIFWICFFLVLVFYLDFSLLGTIIYILYIYIYIILCVYCVCFLLVVAALPLQQIMASHDI